MGIDLILGDCLVEMPKLNNKTIDMILCDLPYGITACKWDTIIPFKRLWEQYERIIKDNGTIVLTASQPFTSALVMSNIKMFKYCLVYEKTKATNYLQAKKQIMKYHEDVCIFYNNKCTYNPQMIYGEPYKKTHRNGNKDGAVYLKDTRKNGDVFENSGERYPSSIIRFKNPSGRGQLHSTQKPVALFEYLIKTYTNEGDLVLDNCAGSGTTGVACKNLKRNCILIEKDEEYFKIAERRINQATENLL
jgi:site-specific DNA-methyltransferase (adenine-specific)